MGITAISGPHIVFGRAVSPSTSVPTEYNEERAPSLYDLGSGFLDPRPLYGYSPVNPVGTPTVGFFDNTALIDYSPTAATSNNLATKQLPVSGTALTLTAGTGNGTVAITAPEGSSAISSIIYIDAPCGGSTSAYISFGQSGTIKVWNPASVAGRTIQVTMNSTTDIGAPATVTIAGRDCYGVKLTETVAFSTSFEVNGTQLAVGAVSQKAFKYVTAITIATTAAGLTSTAAYAGTGSGYGFPIRVDNNGYVLVTVMTAASSNSYLVANSSNGFTYASTETTSISSNRDVRGVWTSTTAISSANILNIKCWLNPTNLANNAMTSSNPYNYTGIFGATQYSSV